MYTGIAETTGKVAEVTDAGEGRRLVISADGVFDDLSVGDSISISGVCLTVEEVGGGEIECFAAEETLERSWFSELAAGQSVTLERPLQPSDRMGGHIVEGHVEDTAEILDIEELDEGWNLTLKKPADLSQYIVEKGYITIEGMSLTVTGVEDDSFSVTIIPETWNISNLSEKSTGDHVNIETDVVARYVENIVSETQ
ncbi:riboflavin synthase [Natrinema sp. H-ect1]|uniref:riboflavin synthase n=1 Tax=Natrinema sp. H-ect1 TaxID=3242700 RepID=UPI00359E34EB